MQFKIEMVHTAKKYASVMMEAESEKEAIEKAKTLKWEDFDDREAGARTSWEVKDSQPWYEVLMSKLGW